MLAQHQQVYIGVVLVSVALVIAITWQSGNSSTTRTAETIEALESDAALVQPSPDLAPDEVVRLQLRSLGNNTSDNRGILQCFCFASPANRRVTGPLARFIAMVRSPPFDTMARQSAALVGRPVIEEPYARVLATFLDELQQVHVFRFELSKQVVEPYVDCWMTDSVIEVTSEGALRDRFDRLADPDPRA